MSIPFRADLRAVRTEFANQRSGVCLGRVALRAGYVGRGLFARPMEGGIIVRLPAHVARLEIKGHAQLYSRWDQPLGCWVTYRPDRPPSAFACARDGRAPRRRAPGRRSDGRQVGRQP